MQGGGDDADDPDDAADVQRRGLQTGLQTGSGGGCMDPTALNYDPSATTHVQSVCTYGIVGCPDDRAINYVPIWTHTPAA